MNGLFIREIFETTQVCEEDERTNDFLRKNLGKLYSKQFKEESLLIRGYFRRK